MELEPRTTAPAHATGAVEFVPLAAIADDATFRLRDVGDVAALAASIGRLGHLVPVELRPVPGAPAGAPPLPGRGRVPTPGGAPPSRARARPRPRPRGARRRRRMGHRARTGAARGAAAGRSDLERLAGAPRRGGRSRRGREELVDEALVRAPVEPELRERIPRVPLGRACAAPTAPADAADVPDVPEDETAARRRARGR